MEEVPDDIRKDIEKFTCKVYVRKKLTSINEVRLQIFLSKYKPNEKKNKPIMDVKAMDESALPSCSRVLQEKITRTALVASRWLSSTEQFHSSMSSTDHRWMLEDGKYKIKWFDGAAAPRALDIIPDDAEILGSEDEDTAEDDGNQADDSSDDEECDYNDIEEV